MAMYDQGAPYVRAMKKDDTIFICQCGKTQKPPFCDGSHSGSDFSPLAYSAEKDGDVYICGCGKTGNKPMCDGSHNR